MRLPCEIFAQYFLPSLRALLAKELIEKHGFSQVEVAKKLGTSPAAISQYLSFKRGNKLLNDLASLPRVKSAVANMALEIASSRMKDENHVQILCKLCTSMTTQDLASQRVFSPNSTEKCRVCKL